MKTVLILACLVCTCAANYYGYGMMGYGYPLVGPFGGLGLNRQDQDERPKFLTCNNAEILADGSTVFAVSVTISARERRQGAKSSFNPWMAHSLRSGRHQGSLSANIEVLNTALSGIGLVAFTTRSQPENGCALDGTADFGSNLMQNEDSSSGFGVGFGFGAMGMGMMGPMRDDDGVLAQLSITAGRVSSLTVDGLPFNSLDELAGRGIVICTSVNSDRTGFATCERPFYACCSLGHDSSDRTIARS